MITPAQKLLVQNIAENMNANDICQIANISDYSSSDSSSDSDDFLTIKRQKIEDFMKTVDSYSDEKFRKNFRLNRETVYSLIELYESSNVCPNHIHGGNLKVGATKEIHIFLWYVANTITYRQMGTLFGLSDSTTWNVVNRVASWLVTISSDHIVWPRCNQTIQQNMESFERMGGISGVLGAIDGSHIKIRRPSINPENYFNRKGYHSVLLQAVVDSRKRFIDVYCGEPGSMHDARVLRRSPLFRLASLGEAFNNTFLLGDSAYPSNFWLVPPYKDTGNLTRQQINFNKLHSSTRIVVENAFGLMKCRFRRLLHFTEHCDLGTVKNIIVASCVLHNLCINFNDIWEEESDDDSDVTPNILEETAENILEEPVVHSRQIERRPQVVTELISKNLL